MRARMSSSLKGASSTPRCRMRERVRRTSMSLKRGVSRPASTMRELATMLVPTWPGIHRALYVRSVDAKVGDQRFGETFHRELGGAVGGVRRIRADRGEEAVHRGGVGDVSLLGLDQH